MTFSRGPAARPPGFRAGRRQWAFSSTELLAILAGLALLAAIILPVMERMRATARLALCKANVGVVNRSVLMYAGEHQETLPLVDPSPPPGGWWWYKEQVKRYAGLTGPSSANDKVFACPSDRGYEDLGRAEPFSRSARHDFTSYVFNGVNLPGMPHVAGWNLGRIREPARTLLVMEWTAHAPLSWHKSKTGRANSPFYNDAENMVGFVDGHVAFIPIYFDGMNPAYTRDPIGGYAYKFSGD